MEKEMFMNVGEMTLPSSSPAILNWVSTETQPLDQSLTRNLDSFFLEKSTEQSIFDSALSSLVSSPTPSNSNFSGGDSFVIRELIGKLGNIGYNSNEIYGIPAKNEATTNSPLPRMATKTSTPLTEFSGDPGFAERAAKFSCFGSQSFNGRTNSPFSNGTVATRMTNRKLPRLSNSQSFNGRTNSPFPVNNRHVATVTRNGKLPRLSSSQSFNGRTNSPFPVNNGHVSTVTSNGKLPRVSSCRSLNGRTNSPFPVNNNHVSTVTSNEKLTRVSSTPALKATGSQILAGEVSRKRKAKSKEDYDSKRIKRSEENEEKTKEDDPYKDFIHVRARRGQATDSHSLAERVRREKISERMKLLQDLVPRCNKVTGKALMLEEIINYVQSLQRQVEFLSMKLSSVNTRLDFNMDMTLVSKDMFTSSNNQMNQQVVPLESNIMVPLETSETHLLHFTNSISQYSTFSEDDLRSIIHGSNQPASHMKAKP